MVELCGPLESGDQEIPSNHEHWTTPAAQDVPPTHAGQGHHTGILIVAGREFVTF
ncbi:MAG: hypothetical protein JWM11_2999 [Planctomycetaceae bacterium]|nr:hypothetical protein [Planctomycetaceae bacterium]